MKLFVLGYCVIIAACTRRPDAAARESLRQDSLAGARRLRSALVAVADL